MTMDVVNCKLRSAMLKLPSVVSIFVAILSLVISLAATRVIGVGVLAFTTTTTNVPLSSSSSSSSSVSPTKPRRTSRYPQQQTHWMLQLRQLQRQMSQSAASNLDNENDNDTGRRTDLNTTTATTTNRNPNPNPNNHPTTGTTTNEYLYNEMTQETDPIRKQQLRMAIVRSIQNSFYATPQQQQQESSSSSSSSLFTTTTSTAVGSNPTTSSPTSTDNDFSTSTGTTITTNTYSEYENDGSAGGSCIIPELYLWCVPWTEVLGRTNVLFVHDAIYTNMFEALLRQHHQSSQPILFGHVHVPSNPQQQPHIQSWRDYQQQQQTATTRNSNTGSYSWMGTIMKLNDYRRMDDGKLILHVQCIERFIITQVHQIVPYGIVTVQLLPDMEELFPTTSTTTTATTANGTDTSIPATTPTIINYNSLLRPTTTTSMTEDMIRPRRTHAIVNESFHKWFPYEYSNQILLPVPQQSLDHHNSNASYDNEKNNSTSLSTRTTTVTSTTAVVSMSDIVGCALAKIVPFAPLDPHQFPIATTVTTSTIPQQQNPSPSAQSKSQQTNNIAATTLTTVYENDFSSTSSNGSSQMKQLPIETQLMQAEMLIDSNDDDAISVDELEEQVWITLNQYYMKSNTAISPYILGILPPSGTIAWPKGFLLEGIASVMERSTSKVANVALAASAEFVRVPINYPSLRRQKRCSYYIAHILESFESDSDNVQLLRQTLLRLPSTKQRLAFILSKLENEVNRLTRKPL